MGNLSFENNSNANISILEIIEELSCLLNRLKCLETDFELLKQEFRVLREDNNIVRDSIPGDGDDK